MSHRPPESYTLSPRAQADTKRTKRVEKPFYRFFGPAIGIKLSYHTHVSSVEVWIQASLDHSAVRITGLAQDLSLFLREPLSSVVFWAGNWDESLGQGRRRAMQSVLDRKYVYPKTSPELSDHDAGMLDLHHAGLLLRNLTYDTIRGNPIIHYIRTQKALLFTILCTQNMVT